MSWDGASNNWNDWKVQPEDSPEIKMAPQDEGEGANVMTLGCDTISIPQVGWTTTCSVQTIDSGFTQTVDNDPEETFDPGNPDRPPSLTETVRTMTARQTALATVGTTGVVSATPGASNNADGAAEATSTPTPTASHSGNDGVSKGAVAGIAIGTAIAGAAFALLIAFLLFKRRNKNGRGMMNEKYESTPELLPSLAKNNGSSAYQPVRNLSNTPPVAAAAIPHQHHRSTSSLPNLLGAGTLPPPAEESTIKSKISTLFNQIHLHVENFYRDVHASITPSMEPELAKFGMGNTNMAELLQSSSQPTTAIKHALVAYVLGITSADGGEDETLFPREVVGINASQSINSSSDLSQAYALYKRLAVHLHTSSNSTPFSASLQSSNVREAAEHFALTFFPWANPGYGDQEKDEDLVQIISNALELMVWLYGQPGTHEFMWEARVDMGRRGTVIAPGLVRTDGGERILLEPQLASS